MTDPHPPHLAIVIVSFNAREDLLACLDSLTATPPRLPHEIVVVDNASGDGSAEAVRERFPAVRVIGNAANAGFARANNQGIRATRGDLVCLLNSDTIVPAGALDGLAATLAADPAVGVVGPRLVDGAGRVELSFGREFGPFAELWQKALVRGHAAGLPVVRGAVERLTRRRRYVDWVSGACLMAWRDVAEAAGLLDERFFMYGEDVDFCREVRKRGRRVLFEPGVEIVHRRGRSGAAAPVETARAYRRSQIAYYEKHRPRWAPWLRRYLAVRGHLPPDA